MTDGDADRQRIRAKLRAGLLPREACLQAWHGPGQGAMCAGCDEPVRSTERECEADFPGGRTLRFHRDCFYAWDEERHRGAEGPGRVDEASAITAVILTDALCLPCIAEKTGVSASRVRAFLSRMRETVALTQARAHCAECSRPSITYRVG